MTGGEAPRREAPHRPAPREATPQNATNSRRVAARRPEQSDSKSPLAAPALFRDRSRTRRCRKEENAPNPANVANNDPSNGKPPN